MTIDEKEYLISRLDVLYNVIKDELVLSKESYTSNRKEEVAEITGRRNSILSGVVVVIAILTILSQTQWMDREIVLILLIIDIVIGLITFVIAYYYVEETRKAYVYVENSINFVLENFNHGYGFIIKETFDLSKITVEVLQIYEEFMKVLPALLMTPLFDALMTGTKCRCLNFTTKSDFQRGAELIKKSIDNSVPAFNKLDQNKLPQELLKQVNEAISIYKEIDKKLNPIKNNDKQV